jgi:hypothetical protein
MKFWTIGLAAVLAVGLVGVAEAKGGKGGKGGSHEGKGKGGPLSMATLDANGDGTVSKEEWNGAFEKLDKDNDGKLTADELKGGKHSDKKGGKHSGGRKGNR